MKDFKIVKGDDIYLTMKKSYYEEWGESFKYLTLDNLIENINLLNRDYNRHLDVSLVDTFTLRVFDSKSNEKIAEYDIDFDLYRSVGEYCWDKIKM